MPLREVISNIIFVFGSKIAFLGKIKRRFYLFVASYIASQFYSAYAE